MKVTDGLYIYGVAKAYTFVQALKAAGPNPTRASLLKAVLNMNDKSNPFLLPGVVTKTGARGLLPDLAAAADQVQQRHLVAVGPADRHAAEGLGASIERGAGLRAPPPARRVSVDELTEQLQRGDAVRRRSSGSRSLAASAEEVRARLAWAEELCTAGGILHGGALMGLADSAGGFCAFLNLPEGATGTATIESKTNFFAPVREGWVEAVSRPLHVGQDDDRRRHRPLRRRRPPRRPRHADAGDPPVAVRPPEMRTCAGLCMMCRCGCVCSSRSPSLSSRW